MNRSDLYFNAMFINYIPIV